MDRLPMKVGEQIGAVAVRFQADAVEKRPVTVGIGRHRGQHGP